jgi:hypothetical protein
MDEKMERRLLKSRVYVQTLWFSTFVPDVSIFVAAKIRHPATLQGRYVFECEAILHWLSSYSLINPCTNMPVQADWACNILSSDDPVACAMIHKAKILTGRQHGQSRVTMQVWIRQMLTPIATVASVLNMIVMLFMLWILGSLVLVFVILIGYDHYWGIPLCFILYPYIYVIVRSIWVDIDVISGYIATMCCDVLWMAPLMMSVFMSVGVLMHYGFIPECVLEFVDKYAQLIL